LKTTFYDALEQNKKFLSSLATGKAGGAVWLGEHHNSATDHLFQAEFIRSMHGERERNRIQDPMVIGLEQVQIQFQSVLDEYVGGKVTLEEMKRSVDWDTRWRRPFEGYQPIFEAARSLRIPLLALNVDSEDLAKVEKDGYPGLPKDRLRQYIKDP
jgi:uncharacterized iron-regulated protein